MKGGSIYHTSAAKENQKKMKMKIDIEGYTSKRMFIKKKRAGKESEHRRNEREISERNTAKWKCINEIEEEMIYHCLQKWRKEIIEMKIFYGEIRKMMKEMKW